jgi:hypothetical protein
VCIYIYIYIYIERERERERERENSVEQSVGYELARGTELLGKNPQECHHVEYKFQTL